MAPLLNEKDDGLSAAAHREFLADMLPRDFGKQLNQCVFISGDNCSIDRRLATLVGVPLVGCASHRLNRAVQQQLEDHKTNLAEVQALMVKLRTLTHICKVALLEHYDKNDDDIADMLPAPARNRHLRFMYKKLKDVESVSNALQGSDVDLLDVREWFDGLIAENPQYASYLVPRSDIVHSPDFESGCVRALRG
ncbi:uncharacterized protein IUM83_19911 [Phytophthora cinnamomi]|uniref:uncharacterized protein n=1 Tax=Phytophthora cinnamomi TaxID=4785 RepID=UPI0035599F1C|nr:hypothetical protein IUM83_19911 [Phytophthora cinnamomi]